MRVLLVHHDPNSTPGVVGRAFEQRGWQVSEHQVCEVVDSPTGSTSFPDPTAFDAVVVFGSRWSVYSPEVAHWVEPELRMLQTADRAGVPVLGCCFGGQLLASALGGAVAPTEYPEIGWFEVEPNPLVAAPVEIHSGPWLQWHGDAFSVPPGATELARTIAGPQAFVLRRNLALQFHPEVDRAVLEAWLVDDAHELLEVGLNPNDLLVGADEFGGDAERRADALVAAFLTWVGSGEPTAL